MPGASATCTSAILSPGISAMGAMGFLRAKAWKESRTTPRFGLSARRTRSHACIQSWTCRPQASASKPMRKPLSEARSASSARSAAERSGSPSESSDTLEQMHRSFVPSSSIRSNLRFARSKLRARMGSGMPSKSRMGCKATISMPRSCAMERISRGLPLKKVRSFSKISMVRKPARAAAESFTSSVPPMQTVAMDHLSIGRILSSAWPRDNPRLRVQQDAPSGHAENHMAQLLSPAPAELKS